MVENGEKPGVNPTKLNRYLRDIIKGKTDNIPTELPDSEIAVSLAESIVREAAKKNSSYQVPRRELTDEKSQETKRTLDDLLNFAPHLTPTGRQVIIGDILEFLYGPGLPSGNDPPQREAIPHYVAGLAAKEDGGLFDEEKALELELLAYTSLKNNVEATKKWGKAPPWLRPLGYDIEDMPNTLDRWKSELLQSNKLNPALL